MVGCCRRCLTGRLPVEVYRQWLAATDVAVQLRRGSRGESSAALADAMAAGLPIIANAHGASAELPAEALVLLPDEADAGAIADALLRLADDPQARRTLGRLALDHAREHLSPEILAARYARAIEAGYAPSALLSLDRAARRAAGTGADLRAVAAALAASFPRRVPRRLLLFSATASGALSELSRALATVSRGWQVEALREEAGTLILDRLAAAHALGLPAVIPDEHFEAGPGDILLLLSGWQECSAPAVHALRHARLAGAIVILAGEPPDSKAPAWADAVIAGGAVAAIRQTDAAPAPLALELAPDESIFGLATRVF